VVGNNVKKIREALMMSKAELARKAGLSTLTIDRVEAGKACRLDTKRKILHALGMKVGDREEVFSTSSESGSTATTEPVHRTASQFSSPWSDS
jgi:predicted transcriptional regulator